VSVTDVEQLLLSELRAIREDVSDQGLTLARVDQRLLHLERRTLPPPAAEGESAAPGLGKAGKAALAGAGAVLGGALAAALQAFVK
jgi:hypothetical protein